LKRLICRGGVDDYILDIYESIQRTADDDWNNGIEILIEDMQQWNFNDCLWDDKAIIKSK
jgi:hypothetical protein